MLHRVLAASCIAAIAASYIHAAPWVRGYVVAFYDPAFRYGGRADYSRGTEIEPGVDCLHGSTVHFAVPAQVAKTLSLRMAASRASASMKTMSRSITRSGAMPTACSMPRPENMTASPPLIASG